MKRFLAAGGAIAATLGAILWFLLLMSTAADTAIFTRHYPLLIGLNVVLALAMLSLVSWQLRLLWRDYRAQVFGARLKLRLMMMFGIVAVLPGALVYGVSVQFVTRSIESWFDVRVERALEDEMETISINYTSGTTGPPKGALIPHRALIGNLPGFVASQDWFPQKGDVFWSPAEACYVCCFRTFKKIGTDGYRCISRTTSKDFLTWTPPEEMSFGDAPPEPVLLDGACRRRHPDHVPRPQCSRFPSHLRQPFPSARRSSRRSPGARLFRPLPGPASGRGRGTPRGSAP